MTEASSIRQPQLSPVLIYLLKGVIYRDQQPVLWGDLERLQSEVMDYVKKIGLDLYMDEAEGFAYLKQVPLENENEDDSLPRLVHRRPLSYSVSLLCALLRKKLVESDAGGGGMRLVLTQDEIIDMMRVFLPERSDDVSIENRIEGYINRVVELGFLKALKSDSPAYEVRRILKAFVDADWLASMEKKLNPEKDNGNGAA